MTLEFGLVVPAGPPKDHLAAWSHLLDTALPRLAGTFTSLWMTDHFFWDDLPTYEAWTVISYLAARYPAFQIGPIVLGQGYRNPALTAKMVATLHALTGGRVIMGIGAGWKEDEYHAYGYPFPSPGVRVGQLEDTLEIFHRLWTQPGPVSYEGAFYRVQSAWCEPRPHPRPPLLVGGGGSKTMQLAVRYADLWNMPDAPYPLYAERVALLRQHCAAARR
ncbi:MAG: LLM class flavin-dependent oxidoreductase, partial [Anaerolineae bacterium]|nr:LLM class flavin-dependent oxidoreductase [Anaerolineae bacterium]